MTSSSLLRQFCPAVLLLSVSMGVAQSTVPTLDLRHRAIAGDAEAQHQLGTELKEAGTQPGHDEEAFSWFMKAANQGHVCATFDVGLCYAMGTGVAANPSLAVAWFTKAAEKGHVEALVDLGMAYHEGMGVARDLTKATECFGKAAQAGHPVAMLDFGVALANGEGIEKNRAEAYQWFIKAEAAGEAKAKEWIDFLRKQGFGLPPVENGTGIVHGSDHAYFIQAPKGWVLDNACWADRGIFAVFYQAGKTFEDSLAIGYTMVQRRSPDGIEAHIKADLAQTIQGANGARVERQAPLKTKDGRVARVYTLLDVAGKRPEWVAYIDAPTVVILVSVSTRDRKDFQAGGELLRDLVASIGWLTDRVSYGK